MNALLAIVGAGCKHLCQAIRALFDYEETEIPIVMKKSVQSSFVFTGLNLDQNVLGRTSTNALANLYG